MKHPSFVLASLIFFLFFSEECLAHKVNVFAFVDGDEIRVECAFSKSRKVKNGRVVVTDVENGDVVIEGATDDQGVFRFRPPDAFLATGHGLHIRLFAGEGHQDDWTVAPGELRALTAGSAEPAPETGRTDAASPSRPPGGRDGGQAIRPAVMDAAELEAAIGKALDAKLSPINEALARLRDDEPGLRDIIGGIGWILGLLGLATYMKYRR